MKQEKIERINCIKDNLIELEHELNSFNMVLDMLLSYFEIDNQRNMLFITKVYFRFLEALHKDLAKEINKLDVLLLED